MIKDFNDCTDYAEFECDLCIVGAGVAGVTLARELLSSGLEITLLESGGGDFEQSTQDMAAGDNIGFPYYALDHSRLRFFGGTCAIWGGRTAQLDAIDFEKRDWVPHSGWPFSKNELVPYYQKAQNILEIPMVHDNELPSYKSPFDQKMLRPSFWQFDEKFDRFTLHNCRDLKDAPNLTILLHATAIKLESSENGIRIESVQIANLKGGHGVIKAKRFVLATGGLEVPRLMLASKTKAHPQGIGNNNDLVGRFFMEHPRARGAHIIPKDAKALFKLLPATRRHNGGRYNMLLRPGEDLQAQEALLNTGFTLSVRRHPGQNEDNIKRAYNAIRHEMPPNNFGRKLWQFVRRSAIYVQDTLGAQINAAKLREKGYGLYAVMRAEQAPNPNSRVTLSGECDVLGLPRIKLDWQFSDIDKHSAAGAMRALDTELRRLDLGHAESASWLEEGGPPWECDPLVSTHPVGGYHHMGTARMADSPKDGVTDADGQVHDIENLYIAGSAVFPTGGWANPTLTIIALTLRMAEKLKSM